MTQCNCKACDENTYEEYLNECYEDIKVCGFEMRQGRILREVDPIAFRCGMADETCEKDEVN